jgi:hypothetical protein
MNGLPEATVLWRPVGQAAELELIEASGWRAFPPRLPHQPIFYPVANEEYAVQIARDWNAKDPASGYVGYVTRFRVCSDFPAGYPIETAGARRHQEYWIAAEEMDAFNAAIAGPVEVVAEFRGEGA